MAKSLEQQLTEVQDAISDVLSGASEYRVGNRWVKRPPLKELEAREIRLKRAIARSSNSPVRVAKIGNPRVTDR